MGCIASLVTAGATLAAFAIALCLSTLIDPVPVTAREIVAGFATWIFLEVSWHFSHHFVLEVDDKSVRRGGRVVRKGHVRYFEEFDRRLARGAQLVISEYGPWRTRLLGGAICIPKGLPDYEKIRAKVSSWAPVDLNAGGIQ